MDLRTLTVIFAAVFLQATDFPTHSLAEIVLLQGVERSTLVQNMPGMTVPCIDRLEDGRLFCVWSAGGAGIIGVYSADSGRTWSKPQTLIRTGTGRDWDPGTVVSGRRILVTSSVPTGADGHSASVTKCVRSDNNGQTWSPMYEIPMNHRYTSGKVGPGVKLRSGILLFPYSWDTVLDDNGKVHSEAEMCSRAGVMRSTDNGLTWQNGGDADASCTRITPSSPLGTDEPKVVQLHDASLYMLMRTGADHLFQARSRDDGTTWTDIGPSVLVGSNAPASLLRIRVGRREAILALWNNAPVRFPLVAATSLDAGHTWSQPVDIAGETGGSQASYPNVAQAPDGTLVAVWQQQTPRGWDVRSARFALIHGGNVE